MDLDDVSTIAVLGAGTMGHGIAEVAAMAGFDVTLRDIEEELVQDGYERIEWSLGKLVEQGHLTGEEAEAALERITPVVDLEAAVGGADVVIEAVPERMDVKQAVYEEVGRYAPEHAVFATNTSSLSISAIAEVTDRPERFCGMHFFNPPVRMQLVEVIAGEHTDEAVLELTAALAEAMGKTPVRVRRDSPGFIVNRILVPLINEASWLVHEGEADVETVDATTKFDMGLPMGAFELADQIGVDVGLHVLEYLHEVLGDAYEPCPLLLEKVDAGEFGRKSGVGFYDYEDGEGVTISADAGDEEVERRLLAVMANETAKLLADDVADPDAIDRALTLGAGFPEGPIAMADAAGLDRLVETLEDSSDRTGAARYEPHPYLLERADEGGFRAGEASGGGGEPSSASDLETISIDRPADHVARVVLDRAHRMNAITPGVLEDLEAAVDLLEADGEVRVVVLEGAGDRAFSVGADVQGLAGDAANTLDALELSRAGQRAFGRLEASDLVVLAAIDGYCLGGGMELATCADLRIATERSTFGQPEHDLGLMPGWGGTQRLRLVVGEGRAKEIILGAERYDAETMESYGFLVELVPNGDLEDRTLEYAADLAAGPPIAQRFTKRAMHAGRGDLEAGLEVEAAAFAHLIGTEDFEEGLAAFLEDREPSFSDS